MEKTQMNVRIPIDIKLEGDSVAARYGKTPSDVVRAVWSFMATYGKLPACVQSTTEADETPTDALDAGQSQAALLGALARQTGLSVNQLACLDRATAREKMFEELLEEHEALNA